MASPKPSKETEKAAKKSLSLALSKEKETRSPSVIEPYKGNPTQPHMAKSSSNSQRVIIITAETSLDGYYDSKIIIEKQPGTMGQYAPEGWLHNIGPNIHTNAYDRPISIEDISSISIAHSFAVTGNYSSGFPTSYPEQLVITYPNASLPSTAFERLIEVEWESGFKRQFTILVPGSWNGLNMPQFPIQGAESNFYSVSSINGCSQGSYGTGGWGNASFRPSSMYGGFELGSTRHMMQSYHKSISNPNGDMNPSENTQLEGQSSPFNVIYMDSPVRLIASPSSSYDALNTYHLHFNGGHPNNYTSIYTTLNAVMLVHTLNNSSNNWVGNTAGWKSGKMTLDVGPSPQEQHVICTSYELTAKTSQAGVYDDQVIFTLPNTNVSSPDKYNLVYGNLNSGSGGFNSLYGGDGSGLSFKSIIQFSMNVETCSNRPSPNYLECDGATIIPANVVADPTLGDFSGSTCCPDCISSIQNSSLIPLSLSATFSDPTTIGGTDGYINVSILDGGFNSSGVPQGLSTGNAAYTYVIQNEDFTDTMCGNTAGHAISSGSVSFSTANPTGSFTFGKDVPSNNNGGLLQTGSTGSATYATTAAIFGYVPQAQGSTNSEGFREGVYRVYVFDTNRCLGQTTVELTEPSPVIGCLDSNALNYDVSANTADNTLCHYCRDSNGELSYSNNTIVAPITAGTVSFGITSPIDTTSTTSEISISGVSPSSSFQSYINNVINASSIQNADYIVELYKWDSQAPSGNSNFGTLTGFNANATIVGTAINNQGNGWNVNLTSATLGAGFTYGYYSIKVYISDPDAVVEIEDCYEIIDVIVQVGVCIDSGLAIALDFEVVSDTNLYFVDSTVCNTVNNFCCDQPIFQQAPAYTTCDPTYDVTISCNPLADVIFYNLQYYDSGNWIDNPISSITSAPASYTTPVILNSSLATGGAGDYRVKIRSQYSNSPDCILYSNIETFTPAVVGCTDPTALDYNAAATCDDGSCTYCVYGCTDATGTNYNVNATCDDGSCTFPIPGCTDITANNYNSSATFDDGSCTYDPSGCTDSSAYNYDPVAVIDDGSCLYCDATPLSGNITVIDASIITGCIAANDGVITLKMTSGSTNNSACTNYTLVSVLDNSGTDYTTSAIYNYNTNVVISNLPGGATYTINLKDCNGCTMQILKSVGTASATCGCTDPSAENYDPIATVDDGSCSYCGCTDLTASNYNPTATHSCTPNNCVHVALPPPCIPSVLPDILNRMQVCISENGTKYHNKLITGMSDDCSIMNVWKVILMNYLLGRIGLECIYNCSDGNTPLASDVYISCDALWIKGGTTTGMNDLNVNTLTPAVGTTPTLANFALGSTYELVPGDIIKHHLSGNIWIFVGPVNGNNSSIAVEGLDPETASGYLSGFWKYCNDDTRYTSNSNNINYLDNFINFANTFCRDCGNDF